ncbi:Endonuclease-reverse transcriptase [Operophtera brumata]|uniref:Endonuclease-reverse transcriptase n=1 Tax=Operophtera brumata TaxID=104452 RepID=A0A0L7L7E1_OPEBR|nr:Endonuclease-reverse transcriptase [Operophtera brumata]
MRALLAAICLYIRAYRKAFSLLHGISGLILPSTKTTPIRVCNKDFKGSAHVLGYQWFNGSCCEFTSEPLPPLLLIRMCRHAMCRQGQMWDVLNKTECCINRAFGSAVYGKNTIRQNLTPCEHTVRSQVELETITWDVIGLSEVRRKGEDLIKLTSGDLFFYRGHEDSTYGGVGFLIANSMAPSKVYINKK